MSTAVIPAVIVKDASLSLQLRSNNLQLLNWSSGVEA
jgi:hypothetical protein